MNNDKVVSESANANSSVNASANSSPFELGQAQKDMRLVDIKVTDDNVALNLMVSFLNLAQKRGAFGLDESSKIWECVNRFIQPNK